MTIEQKVKQITKDTGYEPQEHGICLANMKAIKERTGINDLYESQKFWDEVNILLNNPKLTPYMQLKKWKSLAKQMIAHCQELEKICLNYQKQIDRMNALSLDRSGEKWSSEEDNSLIEAVCNDDISIIELSIIFGRSPSAIQTRISQLVGIKKISSEIAGKFVGTLNGAKIEGNIRGNLVKK